MKKMENERDVPVWEMMRGREVRGETGWKR